MSREEPLRVQNLVKDYGQLRAVDHVDFSLKSGEIFGLLGPNGAGKTSIISVITTLEKATSGKVTVFGRDVESESRQTSYLIGVVPQEVITHGYFTLQEILEFHSGYYGHLKNQDRLKFLMERLQLWDHRNKRVRQLSGGMKRRMMIAKALVHKPRLLLLDEPTAGVDIELREALWSLVRELRDEGLTILLTTHYLEEAEELCDRVGILSQGKLKKIGPTREFIKDLTQRLISFQLKDPVSNVSHKYLKSQAERGLCFQVPSTLTIGELLVDVGFDIKQIVDIKIEEGSLEDAFRNILGES